LKLIFQLILVAVDPRRCEKYNCKIVFNL